MQDKHETANFFANFIEIIFRAQLSYEQNKTQNRKYTLRKVFTHKHLLVIAVCPIILI